MSKWKQSMAKLTPYLKRIGGALVSGLKWVLHVLGLYLDDLLFLAGGACFVRAAHLHLGSAAAYTVTGVCLMVYALVVARSQRR